MIQSGRIHFLSNWTNSSGVIPINNRGRSLWDRDSLGERTFNTANIKGLLRNIKGLLRIAIMSQLNHSNSSTIEGWKCDSIFHLLSRKLNIVDVLMDINCDYCSCKYPCNWNCTWLYKYLTSVYVRRFCWFDYWCPFCSDKRCQR